MAGVVSHFVGEVKPWIGATAPSGWLLCNGAAVNRGTAEGQDYWDLWQVLSNGTGSSPFGNGNGSTTFNVPDLRGRMLVGTATVGEVGLTGGAATVSLTAGHLPAHTHTVTFTANGAHTHTGSTIWMSSQHFHMTIMQYSLIGETTPGVGTHIIAAMESSSGAGAFGPITISTENIAHTHSFTTDTVGAHTHSLVTTSTIDGSANAWQSGAHQNMPPYQVVNFIIKH